MPASAVLAARSHLDFPRKGLPRTLLEAVATIAKPMMVAALYGAAAMGATGWRSGFWAFPAACSEIRSGKSLSAVLGTKTGRRAAGSQGFPGALRHRHSVCCDFACCKQGIVPRTPRSSLEYGSNIHQDYGICLGCHICVRIIHICVILVDL